MPRPAVPAATRAWAGRALIAAWNSPTLRQLGLTWSLSAQEVRQLAAAPIATLGGSGPWYNCTMEQSFHNVSDLPQAARDALATASGLPLQGQECSVENLVQRIMMLWVKTRKIISRH